MIILLCVVLRDDLVDTTCSIYGVGRPLPRAPALLLVYRAFGVPDTRTTANITNDPRGSERVCERLAYMHLSPPVSRIDRDEISPRKIVL